MTAAGYLLIGIAVLAVVNALLPLPYVGHASSVAHKAYANIKNGQTVASSYSAVVYTISFVYLLAGVGFLVLGRFNLRGNNGTRIATFVVGGIAVLCCGANLGLGRLASGLGQGTNGNSDAQAAAKQVADSYPSWLTGTQTAVAVLALLAMIAVLILLALPASGAYYRRTPATLADPGLPPLPYPPVGPTGPTTTPPTEPPAPPSQDQ